MSKIQLLIRSTLLCFFLAACDSPETAAPSGDRFLPQLSQIFADPATAAFFAEEAAQAHVTSIRAVAGLAQQGAGVVYGMTTWTSPADTARIDIFVDVPGARSPTNLAHEISHAAVYRQGCFNHGERWLHYQLGIAQRFEARFPGVKWSGASPTQNVARKAARYPNDHC